MLIGLNGRKQAGKDTVYERTSRLLADVVEVERVSFADLLYRSAAEALGISIDELQAWKSDPDVRIVVERRWRIGRDTKLYSELTIREYLQRYGTEAHRNVFGPDFWVEQVRGALYPHEGRVIVVTDVRFPNEAAIVRECGGAVVEVIGPEGRATADTHASEAPLDEELIDATITNTVRDDGYRTLDGQVDTLLRLHLGGV